jgi:hypothetical protein
MIKEISCILVLLLSGGLNGQPATLSYKTINYEITAPDSIPEGHICVVFIGESNKIKYRVIFQETYEIAIDFKQVKSQRKALRKRKINVRAAVFKLFHSAHNPKVYIMLPIDSALEACQKMPIQIYQPKLFGLLYKDIPCFAVYKPERIYLLIGPCQPRRVFCGEWAANRRDP